MTRYFENLLFPWMENAVLGWVVPEQFPKNVLTKLWAPTSLPSSDEKHGKSPSLIRVVSTPNASLLHYKNSSRTHSWTRSHSNCAKWEGNVNSLVLCRKSSIFNWAVSSPSWEQQSLQGSVSHTCFLWGYWRNIAFNIWYKTAFYLIEFLPSSIHFPIISLI